MNVFFNEIIYFFKNHGITFIFIIVIFIFCGIFSQYWQFWLIFGIILYLLLLIYFSKAFRNLLNIHSIAISLIVFYALPSIVLILLDEFPLNSDERLTVFSAISVGLIGYTSGVLFFKFLFPVRWKEKTILSNKLNAMFWLSYQYRYLLSVIAILVFYFFGFMPMSMSYSESVIYRLETPGVILYFNSLMPTVFSITIVSMISIIGDVRRYGKLSLLSYSLIILSFFSVIGGHRGLLIYLFACLMLVFQQYLKRRYIIILGVLSIALILVISGFVRYSRSGGTLINNFNLMYEYLFNVSSLTSLFWGLDDFTGPFSIFITLVQNIPQNIPFDYTAYIKDLSLWIPTVIYSDRPLPYSMWYVKIFDPETFAMGGGFTFYVLGFGYLFAGQIGVLIHLFLYGYLFQWINKFFKMIGGDAGILLYGYFIVQLIGFVVGSGFFVFIKASLILSTFMPIALTFLFVTIINIFTKKLLVHTSS